MCASLGVQSATEFLFESTGVVSLLKRKPTDKARAPKEWQMKLRAVETCCTFGCTEIRDSKFWVKLAKQPSIHAAAELAFDHALGTQFSCKRKLFEMEDAPKK